MSGDEYADALTASATAGVVGGGIYDAMLAHCALKAKPETISTWNERHYGLCGPEVVRRLRTPKGVQAMDYSLGNRLAYSFLARYRQNDSDHYLVCAA